MAKLNGLEILYSDYRLRFYEKGGRCFSILLKEPHAKTLLDRLVQHALDCKNKDYKCPYFTMDNFQVDIWTENGEDYCHVSISNNGIGGFYYELLLDDADVIEFARVLNTKQESS